MGGWTTTREERANRRRNRNFGQLRKPLSEHKSSYRRTDGIPAHRLIVEQRTGMKLPSTAIVHHVDPKDKQTNQGMFVVCEDTTYHHIIEYRGRALRECGNANWRKCQRCGKWDRPENLVITERPRRIGLQYHTAHQERARKCVDSAWPLAIGDGVCAASPSRRHGIKSKTDPARNTRKKPRPRAGLSATCAFCSSPIRRAHEKTIRWFIDRTCTPLSERRTPSSTTSGES